MNKIIANGKEHLGLLIKQEIEKNGPNCNLNHIVVSNITDMSWMFFDTDFDGDISKWDVSNVTNMSCMFLDSQFNQDISSRDVSNVKNMNNLFRASMFNSMSYKKLGY